MNKKSQPGMTASLKQAVKDSNKSSSAAAAKTINNTAFTTNNNIDDGSLLISKRNLPSMSNSSHNDTSSPRSPSFTKDSISAEKCNLLSPAKKLPSPPHGNRKRPATVAPQIFDVSSRNWQEGEDMLEDKNNSFGGSLDERLSLGSMRGDKGRGKGKGKK